MDADVQARLDAISERIDRVARNMEKLIETVKGHGHRLDNVDMATKALKALMDTSGAKGGSVNPLDEIFKQFGGLGK